jgi:hypothetical protein
LVGGGFFLNGLGPILTSKCSLISKGYFKDKIKSNEMVEPRGRPKRCAIKSITKKIQSPESEENNDQ